MQFKLIKLLRTRRKNLIRSQTPIILTCVILEILNYAFIKDLSFFDYVVFITVILAVIYTSVAYGLKRGLLSAVIGILYGDYVGSKGTFIQFNVTNERGMLLFSVLLLLMATVIGWLRNLIDNAIAREIAAKELAEEENRQLASILNQLPIGVLVADKNARNIKANRMMETIIGRKLKNSMELEDFRIPPQYSNLKVTIRRGKAVKNFEMEFVRPDKKIAFVRIDAAPIKDKKNKVIAWVSAVMDITERKQLENRKDEFINLASHELKTPITSLKLYMDVLEKQIRNTNEKKSVKIVSELQEQIDRLGTLVIDLLDVSRIQTGKLAINTTDFRLDSMIEDALEVLKRTTAKHKLILKKTPATVTADRYRTYQVMTNLVTNAIKYSPAGGDIIISVKKEKNYALVSVQDFGIGIEKDQQDKIFDRLYQVEGKSSTYPGLGLGLYISKQIVKRNKGKMWVESETGKGSTFYFTLPLANN